MATTQYIGSRYVPVFADPAEWNDTRTYEPLTIVIHEGNSYTSKQYVPIGIDISNEDFWALTGNYNAQVEAYRQDVNKLDSLVKGTVVPAINENSEKIAANETAINENSEKIAANETAINENSEKITANETAINENSEKIAANETAIKNISPVYAGEYYDSFYISYSTTKSDFEKQQLIDEYFERTIAMRCKVVLIVHINGTAPDNTLEGLNNIEYLINKCKSNNVTCDAVKFHCTNFNNGTSIDVYISMVETILNKYNGMFKMCWIFNEDLDTANDNVSVLTNLKSKFTSIEFGISLAYKDITNYVANKSEFINTCDVVGMNYYPIVSTGMSAYAYQFNNAFQNFNQIYANGKKVYITECGIKPYSVYLSNPSLYSYDEQSELDYNIPKLYTKAAIENLLDNFTIYNWFSNNWNMEVAKYIGGLVKC